MSSGQMSGGLMSGRLMSGRLMSGGLMSGGLMSGGLMSGGLMPGGLMSGGLMSSGRLSYDHLDSLRTKENGQWKQSRNQLETCINLGVTARHYIQRIPLRYHLVARHHSDTIGPFDIGRHR